MKFIPLNVEDLGQKKCLDLPKYDDKENNTHKTTFLGAHRIPPTKRKKNICPRLECFMLHGLGYKYQICMSRSVISK